MIITIFNITNIIIIIIIIMIILIFNITNIIIIILMIILTFNITNIIIIIITNPPLSPPISDSNKLDQFENPTNSGNLRQSSCPGNFWGNLLRKK